MYKTKVVNIVAGPGGSKSLTAALLFAGLKLKRHVVEYAPEYAKNLVWLEQFRTLDNQHYVSTQQYELIKRMDGKVEFIITDGSLLHGLHYNRANPTNVSNVEKTERQILEYFHEFVNVVIVLKRGDYEYEQAGRQQNEHEAKAIDVELRRILNAHGVKYVEFDASPDAVPTMIEYIRNA